MSFGRCHLAPLLRVVKILSVMSLNITKLWRKKYDVKAIKCWNNTYSRFMCDICIIFLYSYDMCHILLLRSKILHNACILHSKHDLEPWQCFVGLTVFCKIFFTFRLHVRNILQNTVTRVEHCRGSKLCYVYCNVDYV